MRDRQIYRKGFGKQDAPSSKIEISIPDLDDILDPPADYDDVDDTDDVDDNDDSDTDWDDTEWSSVLGTTTDDTYKNEYFDFGFNAGSWIFTSDEELLKLNNFDTDSDKTIAEQIEDANLIFDMQAASPDMRQNVGVNFEKLSMINELLLDEQSYLEAQEEDIKSVLEDMGVHDLDVYIGEKNFAGESYPAAIVTGTLAGMDYYQVDVCVKNGRYIANIAVTVLGNDTIDDVLAKFHKL